MKKYNVLYIASKTNVNTFLKSFENNDKYNIIYVNRDNVKTIDNINIALIQNQHDILHVDDTSILNLMFNNDFYVPDVIGPITRSPIKPYKSNGKIWASDYTEDYFYKSKVVRLNRSEEYLYKGRVDYTDKIYYINNGVDTDLFKPSRKKKNFVLWLGDDKKPGKGYDMWLKIQENVKLPYNYEYKTLTDLKDIKKILDNTKIIVNTSLYESFCVEMFEAKSMEIPSIFKYDLFNGRHLDCGIQVEYFVENYGEEIIKLLTDDDYYKKEAKLSRQYTIDNFSLQKMSETYSDVYDLVIKEKNL